MGNSSAGQSHEARSSETCNLHGTSEHLNSYQSVCEVDQVLQTFDANLEARTNQVMTLLASGVNRRALSLDSLREVIGSLLEIDQDVVMVILDIKEDIWKDKQLLELVEEYFRNSLQTLDFCGAVQRCLDHARDAHLLILIALQHLDEETEGDGRYPKTLVDLKNVRESVDPFTEEFSQAFESVLEHQISMLEKLQAQKRKFDRKMKKVETWRKVSCVIFAATFTAILICSVVTAAVAAPAIAAAMANLASLPLGSMGKWINNLWKKYDKELKSRKEIISVMQFGTVVTLRDMNTIKELACGLEEEIVRLLHRTDGVTKLEGRALTIETEEIRKSMETFEQKLDELVRQADSCGRHIRRARTAVLRKIMNSPNI